MATSESRPGEGVPAPVVRPDASGGLRREAIVPGTSDVPQAVSALSLAERTADAALVLGLTTGDEDAAVAFVRRFQSAVYGLALSITRDPGLAEDVSQEAFVRAWRAAATYDRRKGSVATWLLTITRNAAIDAVRSRRTVSVGDDLLDTLLMSTLGPGDVEDRMLRRLEGARAAARLRTLPPEQARAVVLAVIGGCTAAEVSEREHIPLGTAKTRLRSGLAKLRTAMTAEVRDV
jgi:RNA polymerase sigma factor (sigma-70 family)